MLLALETGWTMALLYGRLGTGSVEHDERLPTEHELAPAQRVDLERVRLAALLGKLKALKVSSATQPVLPRLSVTDAKQLHARLQTLHDGLLKYFATMGRDASLAYQLGRSLRDTANPPVRVPVAVRARRVSPGSSTASVGSSERMTAVVKQLDPGRVAKLRGWLATLGPSLSDDSATIVSASLAMWSEVVEVVFRPRSRKEREPRPRRFHDDPEDIFRALLDQGDAWLNLLIGTQSTSGLLTPESYVVAGEAALSRTVRLIRRVLAHYWFALFVGALAMAGILVIAARELGGAPKVVTEIVTVAGAFGITAKGIASSLATLAKKMETPIYGSAQVDAKAWAVTAFPGSLSLRKGELRLVRRSVSRKSSALMKALQH